jgi:hypothetical protein
MVDSPREEDMKKAWIRRFISIRFRIISTRKKHEVELNHTFKNSSMACVALIFSNPSGSFLIKSKVGRPRRIWCTCDTARPLILESRIGRRSNASFPTS